MNNVGMLLYFEEYAKIQKCRCEKPTGASFEILIYQTRYLRKVNMINQCPTSITTINCGYCKY